VKVDLVASDHGLQVDVPAAETIDTAVRDSKGNRRRRHGTAELDISGMPLCRYTRTPNGCATPGLLVVSDALCPSPSNEQVRVIRRQLQNIPLLRVGQIHTFHPIRELHQ
jgi:hypothetical protein